MAETRLITYKIKTDTGSGGDIIEEDHQIVVYWDDVAGQIVVYELDENGENPELRTFGPDLLYNGYSFYTGSKRGDAPNGPIVYKFCTGANLTSFYRADVFPYARKEVTINHFSCSSVVCDLNISDSYTVVNATDTDSNDGSIEVFATSSNGVIKYSLIPDFDPSIEGQTSGLFENLFPGDYTISAKDEIGCISRKTITVGIPTFYNIKYRLQYFDFNHVSSRVDILERGYTGDIIDVIGTDDPFTLSYKPSGSTDNDKFKVLMPSQAQINLISEENFYFEDLFTQDDRKYLVKFYKDTNQSLQSEVEALDDFINIGDSPLISWALSANPSVSLMSSESSKKLTGEFVNALPENNYHFDYDIDVSSVEASSPLPDLSTFEQYPVPSDPTLSEWELGSNPQVFSSTLATKFLYCPYVFEVGKSYTIYYNIDVYLPIAPYVDLDIFLFDTLPGSFFNTYSIRLFNYSNVGSLVVTPTGVDKGVLAMRGYSTYASYFIRIGSLAMPIDVVDFMLRISLLDRLYNTISTYTRNVSSDGNYTGSIDLAGNASTPAFVSIEGINGDGNEILVEVNSLTNTDGPKLLGYEIRWTGYVIPQNYIEQYLAPPYPISITATDGIADLAQYDFEDQSGNEFTDDIRLIDILSECLKNTDLQIDLVVGVNRFEQEMDLGLDPLSQVRVNPKIFYSDKKYNCLTVIDECLKPFGARILQYRGAWLIYGIEESVHEFNTFVLDSDAQFKSISSVDDLINLDFPTQPTRAAFRDVSQTLEIIPAYGVFNFVFNMLQNASLLKSYSFEEKDIIDTGTGPVFKNWNINISNAPGSVFGIREVQTFDGKTAFFYTDGLTDKYIVTGDLIEASQPEIGKGKVIITSLPGIIEYNGRDSFEFGFEYSVVLSNGYARLRAGKEPFWVKVQWSLKIGDYYYSDIEGWTTSIFLKYNSIYVNEFNEPLKFRIVGDFRDLPDTTTEEFVVEIIQTTSLTIDIGTQSDFDVFKAIPTVNTPLGTRMKLLVDYDTGSGINSVLAYYILEETKKGTDTPSVIRPDDYDEDDNKKAWKLENPFDLDLFSATKERSVDYNYLDNVVFRILPNGAESPSSVTIERVNNVYIKTDFEEEYLLNDVDIDNINNSERTYNNFLKRLDGTPTQVWERTYRTGTGKLLDLLSDDVVSQYKNQSRRLTGSMIANVEVSPVSILTEINDNFKKYMFIAYELSDKKSSINFDLMELKNVVTDDGSEDIDAGFTNGFSLGFRS